ncbi:putative reverse transcriptase domain-containing protein [Tanacetum coccineum]|uniref:Reverse transcriptase domain-containing protein n=1 Tax=Tanacetum coccineum TaxID=301880 RepID=A0ABQ5EYH5_9ASTR
MVRATQPTMIQSVILKAGALTDEAVRCGTFSKSSEKRKEVVENEYAGYHPKCAKCFAYHPEGGPCRLCYNCQKPGYFSREFRAQVKNVAPINAVKMGNDPRVCYECGSPDHLRNTCPKLNQAPGQVGKHLAIEGNQNTRNNKNLEGGRAFNVNAIEALQDPNVRTVRPGYVIEVASGRKVETDRIIRGCILDLGNSLITIDLTPFGYGSFDVIIGMDWLSRHKAMIVCHEKVVRIPLSSGEVLQVQGDRTLEKPKSLKNTKLGEQKVEDIPIVRDFPEVFPKDLSRLPPKRQVEFHIDLVPGATPIVKSLYRLAPSKMQELSAQLQELQDKGFI